MTQIRMKRFPKQWSRKQTLRFCICSSVVVFVVTLVLLAVSIKVYECSGWTGVALVSLFNATVAMFPVEFLIYKKKQGEI